MEAIPREIRYCHTADDRVPFREWLIRQEPVTRNRIRAKIDRVEDGNLSGVESVGDGVYEIKMDFGNGYRVYFGQKGNQIHLISGGTKDRQQADIAAAKEFWRKNG